MNLSDIKPLVSGQSDKFSWLLYKRVKKEGFEQVYLANWDPVVGPIEIERPKINDSVRAISLRLGRMGGVWFHGNRLNQIITPGQSRNDWAYGPDWGTKDWIEVTDWFWSQYLERGRCLFSEGWPQHNWVQINVSARKCAYCGKHERREVKTIIKREREEIWA